MDEIHDALERAGIPVWRDTSALWPGEDWRARIRSAITNDALAFVACFSSNSAARRVTGQNEELVVGIEQLRLRRPDDPWMVPVRLDDCAIPELDIGGGRTLSALQRVDIFDEDDEDGLERLVQGVLRILDLEGPSNETTRIVGDVVASRFEITLAIARLGHTMTYAYAGREPLLVVLLPEAMFFASDLIRLLDTPLSIDHLIAQSYGSAAKTSGIVRIVLDVNGVTDYSASLLNNSSRSAARA